MSSSSSSSPRFAYRRAAATLRAVALSAPALSAAAAAAARSFSGVVASPPPPLPDADARRRADGRPRPRPRWQTRRTDHRRRRARRRRRRRPRARARRRRRDARRRGRGRHRGEGRHRVARPRRARRASFARASGRRRGALSRTTSVQTRGIARPSVLALSVAPGWWGSFSPLALAAPLTPRGALARCVRARRRRCECLGAQTGATPPLSAFRPSYAARRSSGEFSPSVPGTRSTTRSTISMSKQSKNESTPMMYETYFRKYFRTKVLSRYLKGEN